MIVTYTPEDGNAPQTWEFDHRRVRVSEQVLVEQQYGEAWPVFVVAVKSGQALARRVLLWHLTRRDHPLVHLKLSETPDFMDCEFVIEQSARELQENYEAWVATGGPARELGELIQARFEGELEKARARDGGALGKAPSESAPSGTSGS